MMTTPRTRAYGGHSPEERRLARRERLIQAAIRVYGQAGDSNATVKAVCDAAEFTERYFYESFADSGVLLIAAFGRRTNAAARFCVAIFRR